MHLYIRPKNWLEYQRPPAKEGSKNYSPTPPWFRVYNALLSDREWCKLTVDGRVLLITIWCLTARLGYGEVAADPPWLAQQGSLPTIDLVELILHGFITLHAKDGTPVEDIPDTLWGQPTTKHLWLQPDAAFSRSREEKRLRQANSQDTQPTPRADPGLIPGQTRQSRQISSLQETSSTDPAPVDIDGLAGCDVEAGLKATWSWHPVVRNENQEEILERGGLEAHRLLLVMPDATDRTAVRLLKAIRRGATEADFVKAREMIAFERPDKPAAYGCQVLDNRIRDRRSVA